MCISLDGPSEIFGAYDYPRTETEVRQKLQEMAEQKREARNIMGISDFPEENKTQSVTVYDAINTRFNTAFVDLEDALQILFSKLEYVLSPSETMKDDSERDKSIHLSSYETIASEHIQRIIYARLKIQELTDRVRL